jgi:hypothetical protein
LRRNDPHYSIILVNSDQNSLRHFSGQPSNSPADSLCPVCDTPSTQSCADCEQDFCSTHLYLCSDCAAQLCSSCLDIHQTHGHWTDSDTSVELARTHSFACDSSHRHAHSSSAPINIQRRSRSLTALFHTLQSQWAQFFARLNLVCSGASL